MFLLHYTPLHTLLKDTRRSLVLGPHFLVIPQWVGTTGRMPIPMLAEWEARMNAFRTQQCQTSNHEVCAFTVTAMGF